MFNQEILQIVTLNGTPLPMELQTLFPEWDYKTNLYYSTYTIKLDYLGDEHIIPLNRAFGAKQIVHWSCGENSAFDYVSSIVMN